MLRRTPFLVITLILICSSMTPGLAQGRPEDYTRAEMLGRTARNLVFRSVVTPHWTGTGGRFWYRMDLPDSRREFVFVDPTVPEKRPAFDHARIATALAGALGTKVEADRLPIERMQLLSDRPAARIRTGGKTFLVDLQSYQIGVSEELVPEDSPANANVPRQGFRPNGPQESRISPDRRWEVIIRERNLVLKNTETQEEKAITTDGAPDNGYVMPVYWSPDSSRFVVMKSTPEQEHKVYTVESSPRDQLQPKLHTAQYLKPGDRIAQSRPHLFVAAIGKEVLVPDSLFPNPWSLTEVRWDGDSRQFTFLYNQRGHQVMRLVAVDAQTGEAKALIDEQAKTFIDWTNKVYLRRLEGGREAIWMSERDGWNHLYLCDLAAGKVKNQITTGPWVVRGVDRVDEQRKQIWFRAGGIRPAQDPYYVHFCRVNFDGSGLTVLTEGDGTHAIAPSPDGQYVLDTFSRVDMPPVTELRRAGTGGKVLDLEKGDASRLLASGWKMPERFVAKARDGATDIYGVIFRPSNFSPRRKYPVIEQIYAGPQGAFVPKGFSAFHSPQRLAELGFIVVQIDGMGTNFRSKAFHDVCWKNLGDAGFPDRIAWIKAAAEKYRYMDLTRVGLYGTSAGGQNALGGILQYGDFYKACVADCGCHDNRMDKVWWNEQWMGWPVGEHYAEQSNVTLAPRLQGKLLLMVGELDTNVDPASTMQVVNALVKANKDFEFLVMPGGGHGVLGLPYGRRRLDDFFVRTLLGAEPPDRNRQATVPTRAATSPRPPAPVRSVR